MDGIREGRNVQMDGGKIEGWVDRMMNIAKEDRRIEEYILGKEDIRMG